MLSCFRSDFVTAYFLAFSNDSREWTTIHDGYADWVSSPKIKPLPWEPCTTILSPSPFPDSLSSRLSPLVQLFFGNSDKDTPVMNQLAEPVLARYIRIIPQSWDGSLCMRLEVLGCPRPGELHKRTQSSTHTQT